MKKSDKVMRMISFYFSVALFFLLLPIVLSYSLGYHIDFHALKIYRTGIIYVKSQPSGAAIYINSKLLSDVTPARIEELKPGLYRLEVRRDSFYPWQKDLVVRPNMVTKVDDIVLFPIMQEMKRICGYGIKDFAISAQNYIYYMTNNGLFRSNLDGTNIKKLTRYSNWPNDILGRKFSPGGDKLLYFNNYYIWVIYLNVDRTLAKESEYAKVEEVLKSPNPIKDVYWYSESKHIVFVTDKDINVMELYGEGARNIVMLYKFNTTPANIYYDDSSDSLYFRDFGKGPASQEGNYLYRLDLRQKFFDSLMRKLKKEFDIKYETRKDL